jgi:2-polyprenyl-3-methyl-5-hydroxy-6-metoxy-1,4-benzoquinol methylase
MSDQLIKPNCRGGHSKGLGFSERKGGAVLSPVPAVSEMYEKRALENGCGGGAFSRSLCEKGRGCLGIDVNEERIETARRSLYSERLNSEVQKF